MSDFRKKFSSIKDRPTRARLPRLGYIRLGEKVKKRGKQTCKCGPKEGCMFCTYPRETDYFVCPDEIKKVYGDRPKILRVMLPIDDEQACFNTRYVFYGMSRGWKCMGNGEIAERVDPENKTIIECACPGPHECTYHVNEKGQAQCSLQGTLQVIVLDQDGHPLDNTWGVYWINTGSETSRIDITSGIRLLGELTGGRIALIPLILKRVETVMHIDEKRRTHWTLQMIPAASMEQLGFYRSNPNLIYTGQTYSLPEPEIVHPATMDDPVVVDMDEVDDLAHNEILENEIPEVEVSHTKDCTCEICMEEPEEESVRTDTPEENGDPYALYANLQQELADMSDDKTKTADDITVWQKDNIQRINKLPPTSDDGMNQAEILKVANLIKRKKRA